MYKDFGGIITALLTPFDKNDRVNSAALKQLIGFNLDKGVSGFYVTGSTGEAFLMSEDERRLVMKTVKEAAGDKVKLIAHIGSVSPKEALRLASYAGELGYDAVSSVAPFYYKYSFAEIKDYYFSIAGSVSLPVIIYNIPLYSGVSLSVDNISEFLSDDRFIGVKHTSQDYFALRQFTSAFPGKSFFNGFDETFLAGLAMGADGAIGSTYNFMADKFVSIDRLYRSGDIAGAEKMQKCADEIIAALCKAGVMQGEKAILTALGIDCGECRRPFRPLEESVRNDLLEKVLPLL